MPDPIIPAVLLRQLPQDGQRRRESGQGSLNVGIIAGYNDIAFFDLLFGFYLAIVHLQEFPDIIADISRIRKWPLYTVQQIGQFPLAGDCHNIVEPLLRLHDPSVKYSLAILIQYDL